MSMTYLVTQCTTMVYLATGMGVTESHPPYSRPEFDR